MRARVHSDDSEHAEYVVIAQELRQGCVLSPLLWSMCPSLLTYTSYNEVRFSKDEDIRNGGG